MAPAGVDASVEVSKTESLTFNNPKAAGQLLQEAAEEAHHASIPTSPGPFYL